MTTPLPANFLTATETINLISTEQITVTQIAEHHIERFEQRDSAVRAWAWYDKGKILRDAQELDRIPKEKRGPLFGVMIGLKDVINTLDMPTQHYSKAYGGHQPGEDATVVHILRNAGALMIGKTEHTTEFARSHEGPPTRNPFDSSRTPGGSSSGSAAAVRDFQCHVSLGTQTAGSIIRPASFNGVFGMKPTWNSVPRNGIKISSLILDTPGFYARSISDLQLLLRVLNVCDDIPPPIQPKPLSVCRFAFVKTTSWDSDQSQSKELEQAWHSARKILEEAGAYVEDVELDPAFDNIVNGRHTTVMTSDARVNLYNEFIDPSHRQHIDPGLLDEVKNTSQTSRQQILEALDSVASLRPVFDRLSARFDAVVTPSVPGEAPKGSLTGDSKFNAMWTMLHAPCINIPGFCGENGMPIGLTLVNPRYHDERLLSVSRSVAAGAWLKTGDSSLAPLPAPQGVTLLQV